MLKTSDYFNHLLNKFAKNHQLLFYPPLHVHQNVLQLGADALGNGVSSGKGSVVERRLLVQSLEIYLSVKYACKPRFFTYVTGAARVCCAGGAGCLPTPAYKRVLAMTKTPLNCQN